MQLAKLSGRIEHDYRELKQCLSLDRLRGPRLRGLHHQLICVTVAHPFLTCCRLARAAPTTPALARRQPGPAATKAPRDMQTVSVCWHGHCPTCQRGLPP